MPLSTRPFRIRPGDDVDLKKLPTRIEPVYRSKDDYAAMLEEHVQKLSRLQELLYATNQYSVLILFQALDAAGKDGAIKHVLSGINPQGCDIRNFGKPSTEELDHDFLWRTNKVLPERGRIGIFNRSYYEEVLVVRVHPELLAAQRLPGPREPDDDFWQDRFRSITEFEAHQHRNGMRIVKIYLHVSKDEQRQRLLERIDTPAKNWKFQAGDIAERKFWKLYRKAYEACLAATSTKAAPWFVVPADDKLTARLIVSQIVLEALEDLGMSYPEPSSARRAELAAMRKELEG